MVKLIFYLLTTISIEFNENVVEIPSRTEEFGHIIDYFSSINDPITIHDESKSNKSIRSIKNPSKRLTVTCLKSLMVTLEEKA